MIANQHWLTLQETKKNSECLGTSAYICSRFIIDSAFSGNLSSSISHFRIHIVQLVPTESRKKHR